MHEPELTVIILTYNRDWCLGQAIKGVLDQTFQDFELYILDNASTDNTAAVVSGFHDPRIKYVRHTENIGSANNANFAFKMITTPYFILTHDDDIMLPNMLEKELQVLKKYPEIVMVACNADIIDVENKCIKKHVKPIQDNLVYRKNEYIQAYCNGTNDIMCPTGMFRTDFMKRNNLFIRTEVGPVSDVFLWFEINLLGNIYILEDVLYLYRIHATQDSGQSKLFDMHMLFYQHAIRFLGGNNLSYLIPNLRKSISLLLLPNIILNYMEGTIDKKVYLSQIDILKENVFLDEHISKCQKMKIFFMARMPYFFKGLFRLKKICRCLREIIKMCKNNFVVKREFPHELSK